MSKHVKVTLYMPPSMVAELDDLRADLRRAGAVVDRGRMIRAAIRVAKQRQTVWASLMHEEEDE